MFVSSHEQEAIRSALHDSTSDQALSVSKQPRMTLPDGEGALMQGVYSADDAATQGCLRPVDIRIPKDSILWPDAEAAVVGGNVQTSQRVTDVILRAFNAAAASQGW